MENKSIEKAVLDLGYKPMEFVGKGAYGMVYKYVNRYGDVRIVKIMDFNNLLIREIYFSSVIAKLENGLLPTKQIHFAEVEGKTIPQKKTKFLLQQSEE